MYFNSNRLRMELGNSDYRIIEFYGEPTLIEQEFNDGLLVKEFKYSLRNELIAIYNYEYDNDLIIISIHDKENNLLNKLLCSQHENILTVQFDNHQESIKTKTEYIFNDAADYYYLKNDIYNVRFEQNDKVIYKELNDGYERNGELIKYKMDEFILNKIDFSFSFTNYDMDGSVLIRDTYFVNKCKISHYEENNLLPDKSTIYNFDSNGQLLNIEKWVKDIFHQDKYSIEKINDEENIDVLEKDKLKRDNSNWFKSLKDNTKNTLSNIFSGIISAIGFILVVVVLIGWSFLDEIKDYYLWDEFNLISILIDSNKDLDTELKEIYEVFNSEEKYSIDDLKSEYIENEEDNSKYNIKKAYIEFLNNRDIYLDKMKECGDSIAKYKSNYNKSKDYYFRYSKLILDIITETTKQMEVINIKNIKLVNQLIDYNISDNTPLFSEYDILLLYYNFYIYLHKFYNVERDFILANLDSFKFENNIIFPTVPELKVELDDLNADLKNMKLMLNNRLIKVQEYYDQ